MKGAICLIAGVIGGAALFAMAGTITGQAVWGGVAGAASGALAGWGWKSGYVSSAVAWLCCFAVAGAFIGPGYDADALSSALWFGGAGAFLGYMPWRVNLVVAGLLFAVCIHPGVFWLLIIYGLSMEKTTHRQASQDGSQCDRTRMSNDVQSRRFDT